MLDFGQVSFRREKMDMSESAGRNPVPVAVGCEVKMTPHRQVGDPIAVIVADGFTCALSDEEYERLLTGGGICCSPSQLPGFVGGCDTIRRLNEAGVALVLDFIAS